MYRKWLATWRDCLRGSFPKSKIKLRHTTLGIPQPGGRRLLCYTTSFA